MDGSDMGWVESGRAWGERAADWDRDRQHIASVAEAGATWWTEWVKPGNKQRTIEAVRRGPLRAD